MSEFQVTTLDDMITQLIMNYTYQALESSKFGPEMPQVPYVSRYFIAYLTFFVAVAPFFRSKDPRVASRTDKFFAKDLDTLANVDLSAYLRRKATAWYRRFPPVHSPDRMDNTQKIKDHEGPDGVDAGNVEDVEA